MDGRNNWIYRKLNNKANTAKYKFQILDGGNMNAKFRMVWACLHA